MKTLRDRFFPTTPQMIMVGIGTVMTLAYTAWYLVDGYSVIILAGWFASLGIFFTYFAYFKNPLYSKLNLYERDTLYVVFLSLILAPLFLVELYSFPVTINTDEITIMNTMKSVTSNPETDLFGPSNYYGFPNLIFVAWGKLALAVHDIDLHTTRFLHGLSGLLIALSTYFLFRILSNSATMALAGGLLIGTQHALLAVSRMGMRDNIALLCVVTALIFLIHGLQSGSKLATFTGGAIAGFAFYGYMPGRVTIVIWTFFIIALLVLGKRVIERSRVYPLTLPAVCGFVLMILPLYINPISTADNLIDYRYKYEQILLLPEGRELQQWWVAAETQWEGVAINIRNGLTAFNNDLHDHGYIYLNFRSGFFDPLSGILLWIGMIGILIRKQFTKEHLLVGIGFFTIYLILAFVTVKAPQYTRMFVILPFALFFVVKGAEYISRLDITRLIPILKPSKQTLATVIFWTLISTVVLWNLAILHQYFQRSIETGDIVGNTGRYIATQSLNSNHSFYLVTDSTYPYYSWGETHHWKTWLSFFMENDNPHKLIAPMDTLKTDYHRPATIFMSRTLYDQVTVELNTIYPTLNVIKLTPDGNIIGIELE